MKITSISKAAIAVGINALMFGGLVVGPANADPGVGVYGDLVGTGSDTTQDVLNGLSTALGENPETGNRYIASYDAAPGTGAGSIAADCNTANDKITPQESGGPTFVRPNGSSNGLATIRAAIGQTNTASVKSYACLLSGGSSQTLNATDIGGAVHFGRTSSGPSAGDASAVGTIAYVPFAYDAMTVAVSPTTEIPALTFGTSSVVTAVGGVTGKVESTLYAIYNCKATKVVNPASGANFLADSTYVPAGDDVVTDLKAYIPQSGSGTRSYWIGKFGVTEQNITDGAAKASCLKDVIVGGTTGVQEHNGAAVGTDNYAITPFSIPQFVAQSNGAPGVTSRVNGAALHAIGGVNPTTGSAPSLALNTNWTTDSATSTLARMMYNMVPSRELDDPDSVTHLVFNGQDSLICQESETISTYGFAPLTATSGSLSCGYTDGRYYAPSTTTFAIDVTDEESSDAAAITTASTGDTVYFRVKNLLTNGDGGGTVELSVGDEVFAEFDVDAGASNNPETATTDSWVYGQLTVDGTFPEGAVDATFIPTLSGVATSTASALVNFSIDQIEIDSAELTLYTNTYKVGKKGKIDVLVTGAGDLYPTGTITVKNGTKVLGSAELNDQSGGAGGNIAQRLDSAATVINLKKFTKKGRVTLTIEYSGDDTFLPYSTTQQITVKKK
jgi:hypothetical protein